MSNSTASNSFSYKDAGVDIDVADAAKLEMKETLASKSSRVLNSLGAFASLVDIHFETINHPILVMKMEEPGSKQLLAAQHGRLADVGYDLVNHLINDTIMMGAKPLAVQDTIVCGNLDKQTVVDLVAVMHAACAKQECDLVGGETSEQPRVIPEGSYILSAACVGIVDKVKIIDGSAIRDNDVVLAVASNGVHTNGYTLIRSLLDADANLAKQAVADTTFIDAVLKPHECYNLALQDLFKAGAVINGLAHITGGGIVDNTKRIIPAGLCAEIDLGAVTILPIFETIAAAGNVTPEDMLRTFNCGVGMVAVVPEAEVKAVKETFAQHGQNVYPIGRIAKGEQPVVVSGALRL